MRKLILVVLLVSCCILVINSDEIVFNSKGQRIKLNDDNTWFIIEDLSNTDLNFRNSKWGDSIEEIKASENLKVKYESETLVVYEDDLVGLSTDVVYIFINNKLIRSKYVITENHSNKTQYITDYQDIKKLLIKKYGQPGKDELVWKNDLYKSDPSEWGMAIAVGHLTYYALWENDLSSIFLYLDGDNYDIEFGIEYTSQLLGNLEEIEKAKENSNKL